MTRDGAGVPPGHVAYAPPIGEPIRWAPAFGRRFTVFADIEEEFDWRAPLTAAHRSTDAMRAFPAAHRRFAAAGVGLACMVDHPVASDPAAVEAIAAALADGRSTLGAQLHAWVTPPHAEVVTPFTSHAGNLPRALEAAKLAALTDAVATAFGVRPLAFRAGRYGLGPRTWELLAAAGYRLDSSIRARYDYRAGGGPDFRAHGNVAFRAGELIELPLTTLYTGWGRRAGPALDRALSRLPRGRGLASRAGLLDRVALTPEDMPLAAALRAVDAAALDDERLLVLSFHSPSLEPGHTPYVRDEAGLRAFWAWWDAVFDRLATRGFTFASLDEIVAAAG